MFNRPLGVLRFFFFVLITVVNLIFYLPLLLVSRRLSDAYRRFYFRWVVWLCGFEISIHGIDLLKDSGSILFISNHSNYFDIPLLGSVIKGNFIAKSEVRQWPFFGFLAWVAGTVFVVRKRGSVVKASGDIAKKLNQGRSLILFPEGTSSDGNRVLPFKSSMLSVTETPLDSKQPLIVQPLSLSYTRLDGFPMGWGLRPFYAWYGDMELVGHLLTALSLGNKVGVDLVIHPPVTIADFSNRKALSNHCHDVVSHGVSLSLSGRLGDYEKSRCNFTDSAKPLSYISADESK